ncbi:hypothetical protein GCM10025777_22240 [Membranihabitans marinus]
MVETPINIVEAAQSTETLSSLVAALSKADENNGSNLIATLSGNGPFTVFAPTNAAFDALFAGLDQYNSLSDFTTEEDKAILSSILQYHVVAGAAVTSSDLSNGQEISTVLGEKVIIKINGNTVSLDDDTDADAQVTTANIEASNGIVHIINKVLVPQSVLDAINIGSLVEIVVASDALTLLEAAVIKTDLVATLNSDGPFTVFAPSDDAFIALLDVLGNDYNSLDDFDTDDEINLLKDILLYHVLPAKVSSGDLAPGSVATALANNDIEIIAAGSSFVIGDDSEINANISMVDIMASNGIAHVIDKVLLPQTAIDFVATLNNKNIVELTQETESLSSLLAAIVQADAGLAELLQTDGPFTVFAPTNDAFAAVLDLLGDDYNSVNDFDTEAEKTLLAQILKYHVVAGAAALSTDLSEGQMITTAQGEDIGISLDGGVFVTDATDGKGEVKTADIQASNGVVHLIDKVLLPQEILDAVFPQPNIVDLAQGSDDLSILVAALVQADAGLVELLQTDGPFTVFAPTNAAFVALLDDLGDDYNSLADFDTEEEKTLLANILKYHVVSGVAAYSTDLSDGQEINTALGSSVSVKIDQSVEIVDSTDKNATVLSADIAGSNGVVHVIDKVLLPSN